MSVFHFLLITLKLKVDDLDFEDGNVDNEKSDEEKKSDMENDDDIVEDKNVTDVDLDFEDDNVDNEKSDEEEESDTDHNIEENKNELNKLCEYKAYDGNVPSVSL